MIAFMIAVGKAVKLAMPKGGHLALSEVVVASFDSDPDQGCPLGRLQSGSIILEICPWPMTGTDTS